jgi:predicted PurR-regulated permease PerM
MDGTDRARISLLVAGVVVLVLLVLVPGALFVLFAAVVLAVVLDGAARALAARLALRHGAALAVIVFGLVALAVLLAALAIPQLIAQGQDLAARLPGATDALRVRLGDPSWLSQLQQLSPAGLLRRVDDAAAGNAAGLAARAAGAVLGAVTDTTLALLLGLYLAAEPTPYRHGMLALLAPCLRPPAADVMRETAAALRGWFRAQLLSMTVVGLLSWAGLATLGVPLAEVLAALAFVLGFVPLLGPIVAAVPALLIAASEGLQTAAFVAALYVGIQVIEGNVVTPLIQQQVARLPPALLLGAQMLLGLLFGLPALILAAPLTVTLQTVVRAAYVERWLERRGATG